MAAPRWHSCGPVGRVTKKSQDWCHILHSASVSLSGVLSLHRGYGCVQKNLCFLVRAGLDWWINYSLFHASGNVPHGACVPAGDPWGDSSGTEGEH